VGRLYGPAGKFYGCGREPGGSGDIGERLREGLIEGRESFTGVGEGYIGSQEGRESLREGSQGEEGDTDQEGS
jgi:hypothetical protein